MNLKNSEYTVSAEFDHTYTIGSVDNKRYDNIFLVEEVDSSLGYKSVSINIYSEESEKSILLIGGLYVSDYSCFGIYKFNEGYIIHGELDIIMIDKNGNIKWSFSGRDIFVLPSGEESFTINGDKGYVIDWDGYRYDFDTNGLLCDSKI